MGNIVTKRKHQYSIYARIMIVLLANSFITFCLIFTIFYVNMKEKHEITTKNSIEKNLMNIRQEMDNIYSILADVSLLLSTDTEFIENINRYYTFEIDKYYQSTENILEFASLRHELQEKLNSLISFNHSVGTINYYPIKQKVPSTALNSTKKVIEFAKNETVKPLYFVGNLRIDSIHQSIENEKKYIISVIREIAYTEEEKYGIYIESNIDNIQRLFYNNRFSETSFFIITNTDGEVVFSENESVITNGNMLKLGAADEYNKGSYYLFQSPGNSYVIWEYVPVSSFQMNLFIWNWQFVIAIVVLLSLIFFLTFFIWRALCRPMKILSQEFQLMANGKKEDLIYTGITEYDHLLEEFYIARASADKLYSDLLQKEQKQKELEIERIFIQINPHFIHNTLNCIQWMARSDGNKDIEKMVILFTRVLNYNLGKEDIWVTVSDEINAMRNYVALQKMKKDSRLNMVTDVSVELMDCLIPRFILQPLIENAIKYNKCVNGNTIIRVATECLSQEWFVLSVWDNGNEMSEEVIADLSKGDMENSKLGIGLKFVSQMIRTYYGDEAEIYAENNFENGTKVSLKLPIHYREVDYDTSIDC